MVDFMTPPNDAYTGPSGPVWLSADGIVITVSRESSQDLQAAIGNMECTRLAAAGKPRPLLVDMTNVHTITKAAREEYVKQREEPIVSAVALVTASNVSKMVGNLFIRLNPGDIPARLFTDAVKARDWLMQYR